MADYDEQLDRALDEAPGIEGDGERFDVPDPTVRQEGNVTVYENFRETVDRLDREAELVLRFLQNELGTSAHIDERGRARFTGDFTDRRIGSAVEEFVDTHVRCPECDLPDTHLVDEAGSTAIRCDACGALSPTS